MRAWVPSRSSGQVDSDLASPRSKADPTSMPIPRREDSSDNRHDHAVDATQEQQAVTPRPFHPWELRPDIRPGNDGDEGASVLKS